MRVAIGPIPYYWPRPAVLAFYEGVARCAADVVYLGETICPRRHELRLPDWLDLAGRLAAAGKQAVLSTQALVESESDLRMLRRIAANGRFRVEANDMAAVRMLAGRVPFVAGSHLNVYNPETLEFLASLGAERWVAPAEMPRDALAEMLRRKPEGLETEVFAHGRLGLALSARCFTARRFNRQKDSCGFVCLDHPEGLPLHTGDGQPFLVLNGTQTQSASVLSLARHLPDMARLGVDLVRIGPRPAHTAAVANLLKRIVENPGEAAAGADAIESLEAGQVCDGYWHGAPGIASLRAGAIQERLTE
jgi:collagenase-like PrtC family protease